MLAATATIAAAAPPAAPDPLLAPYAAPKLLARLPDGRRINLVCMGHGSPTVIMTAGLGDWSAAWRKVQGEIAADTRVCAWDRAGFGFSDPSPAPQDLAHTTADLEQALKAAGIAGPYVVAGHSLGGYESLLFADRHRGEVAGMVLVDPSVPGQSRMFAARAPRLKAYVDGLSAQAIDGIRSCVDKLKSKADAHACLDYPPDYPPDLKRAMTPYDLDPARGVTEISLYASFDKATDMVVDPARTYGDMPLVVLSALGVRADLPPGAPPEAMAEMDGFLDALIHDRDTMAALSTRGVNRRIEGTSHYIQMIKPEVVIAAIREVVGEARASAAR